MRRVMQPFRDSTMLMHGLSFHQKQERAQGQAKAAPKCETHDEFYLLCTANRGSVATSALTWKSVNIMPMVVITGITLNSPNTHCSGKQYLSHTMHSTSTTSCCQCLSSWDTHSSNTHCNSTQQFSHKMHSTNFHSIWHIVVITDIVITDITLNSNIDQKIKP